MSTSKMTKDKETFKANRRSVENYMYIVMLSWMREMHEIVFGTHTHTCVDYFSGCGCAALQLTMRVAN